MIGKWFCRHKRAVLDLEMELSNSKDKSGYSFIGYGKDLEIQKM
jgi:hypothetical protein